MTSYRDTSRDQRRSRNNDWADWAPSADTILRAARNRPEAVLVLAAGVALLLRGASKMTSSSSPSSSYDRHIDGVTRSRSANRLSAIAREQGERIGEWTDAARDTANETVRTVRDTARDTSERMTGYASDMIDQISETASDYASTASHWADEAREGFSHQSQRVSALARDLPDDLDHAVREHPLVVAALGIAVGAAIGASLPSTRLEARAMGDARDHLFDAARQARGRVGEAAEEAYEEVKRAADERGLNVEGVTEVARDAAKTFAAGVTGQSMDEDKGQKSGASQGGQKPQGSNPSPSNPASSSQSSAQSSSQSSGQGGSSSQARASSPQTSKS